MASVWKLSFITADSQAAELALEDFGATTWATQAAENGTQFEVYFDGKPALTMMALPGDAAPVFEKLPDLDWVSESQKELPPIEIRPFYLHGSHDAPRGGGWRNIVMQAGIAFGSGHHGTTQGCLHLLAHHLKRHQPSHVADIGCGSGILAIAAAQAGCRNIMASDNDAEVIDVARGNARLNQCAPSIECFAATGMQHPKYHARRFDLILANILAAPLKDLAGDFERHMSSQGRVIISGLLNEQARRVIARYRAVNLKVEQKITIGPWTSLCLKR